VVFDEELSPAQGRNIQNALAKMCGEGQVKVLDRTMLILQVFFFFVCRMIRSSSPYG